MRGTVLIIYYYSCFFILNIILEKSVVETLQQFGDTQVGHLVGVIRRFGIVGSPGVEKDLSILIARYSEKVLAYTWN